MIQIDVERTPRSKLEPDIRKHGEEILKSTDLNRIRKKKAKIVTENSSSIPSLKKSTNKALKEN